MSSSEPNTSELVLGANETGGSGIEIEYVKELAARKIRGFRGTIDERGDYLDEVYQSNARLTANIASDYRDRFLIELIQNAYDAHPAGTRGGQIKVILDMREGEYGTLFVANKGRPFAEGNVKDLCDIGLSRKPLGESIGNKGLGFRSVVQITDAPCIYSQSVETASESHFSGFCFRFAEPDDYAELIDDRRHLQLARRDLPIFHIPIWIDVQTRSISAFAEEGFSTVIQLPLRDAVALDSVRRQIIELRDQKVPMLLFLERASSLAVRIVAEAGQIETELAFSRSEDVYSVAGMQLARVDLRGAGTFFMARRRVAESKMKGAIEKGIARKELNEHWERWAGDGEVAVAVRLDAVVPIPRLYTFLPMGEQADAPFAGHLHGSFFPSSNRKHLNARIQLNALLLTEATSLAAEAIKHLVNFPSDRTAEWLTSKERATAVVDLLCWAQVGSLETDEDLPAKVADRLTVLFGVDDFQDAPLVPCLAAKTEEHLLTWQPPASARRWPEGHEVFSAEVAAEVTDRIKVRPIWDQLADRLEQLDRYLAEYADSYPGLPQADERARLVNIVAKTISSGRKSTKSRWLQYFSELPTFMGKDGRHLAGLPVLLGDDGELHAAMATEPRNTARNQITRRRRTPQTAVFSPPDPRRVDGEDDLDVKPPKRLSRRVAFLSPTLPWHAELASTRSYLEQHSLVERFDRESIFAHLSRTLQRERNREVLKGGLRWAFQLWRQPRAHGRAFRMQPEHPFSVPTLEGAYIPAGEAIFSAGWPTETAGELLQSFLDTAPQGLPDVERLAHRRLAAPDHTAFRERWIDDWVQFLTELGVASGLHPEIRSAKKTSFPAHEVSDFSFLENYGIPRDFGSQWSEAIASLNPSLLHLPSGTTYVINGDLTWLPGQADVESFSPRCTASYAMLILRWLSETSNLPSEVEVHHHFTRWADRRDWPSPAMAFLISAKWFPIEDPGPSGAESVVVRPSEVWMFDGGSERFVPFLRRPVVSIRRQLERASERLIQNLKVHAGLRIFNDPAVLSAQLEFLAQQYVREGFDRFFERHLINLYNRSWLLLANADTDVDPKSVPSHILAKRGQVLHLVTMPQHAGEQDEVVYVCDTEREGDVSLLEASGRLFFDLREGEPKRIGELMEALYSDAVRRLSSVKYGLLADGCDIEGSDVTPVLTICPQLRSMLAIAMEALNGTEAQRLPSDRALVLARLERLLTKKAGKLSFKIDGIELSADEDKSAFHFRLQSGASVVVVGAAGEWSWEVLDRCMPAIAEAVGYRSLAPHMRLLVADLRNGRSLRESVAAPFDDLKRFASVLQLSHAAAEAARATISAGLERVAPWIRAVLHLMAGAQALQDFDKEGANVLKDVLALEQVLSKLLNQKAVTADKVVEVARTALGPKDFREGLQLDFSDFNSSLIALGMEPEAYPDTHKSRLENFIRVKEVEITDCLRTTSAMRLKNMEPAETYGELRGSFRNLVPDPKWLLEFEEPPQHALAALVNSWLAEQEAPPLGHAAKNLAPLSEVRTHNHKFVREFIQEAAPFVRAWCAKNEPDGSTAALLADDESNHVRKRLDDVGVLDFQPLDQNALLRWLHALELWPTAMPLALDLKGLDLSEGDLSTESVRAREANEERKRETRSVPFNGRIIDPIGADLFQISEELGRTLSAKVLGRSLGTMTDLAEPNGSLTSKPKEAGNRSPKGSRPRVPEEKTELIGRLGEVTIYHWLRKILPNQDIDAAWRSENGELITGRKGRDGLGYDFEVSYRNQIWQIEVKASLDDPQSFEMGETEVAAARAAARPRSGVQYKIAYVSYVSEPARAMIEMLPNPMSEDGARVLELRGEGIRYGFRRSKP
ncbi:MAG: hypothetical protein CML30_12895 [Rhizobiales bacterium]|nr:hypothetical protein [Hyphomicrobiales bacterium]